MRHAWFFLALADAVVSGCAHKNMGILRMEILLMAVFKVF